MKSYTMYVCETCEFECRSIKKMMEHEAEHLGLTVKELEKYNAIQSWIKYVSGVVATTNNKRTREEYDKAIENLIAFEEKHGIKV